MKIDIGNIPNRPEPANAKEQPNQTGREKSTVPSGAEQKTDSIKLTNTANQLKQAEKSLQSVPEVDAGRIAEITRAIERGEYPVDPKRLADKFLQLEREVSR